MITFVVNKMKLRKNLIRQEQNESKRRYTHFVFTLLLEGILVKDSVTTEVYSNVHTSTVTHSP